jgi:hypothetical protein
MDKHKQFTENIHPIGTTFHPEPVVATAVSKPAGQFKFTAADLNSDFTADIDPDAPLETKAPTVITPPIELIDAPDEVRADKPLAAVAENNVPPATHLPKPASKIKNTMANRYFRYGAGVAVIGLVAGGILVGTKLMAPKTQMINSSAQLDQSTVYIDSKTHSVGIKASTTSPDGLQVGSTVTATPQGASNIRMGLVSGTDPSIFFEDNQKNSWQILGVGGSLQLIQGTQFRAKLDSNALSLTNALNVGGDTNANANLNVKGNTTLGDASTDLLTIQSNTVATPNNLNFGGSTLVIESNKGNVAIGAATAGGYKLLVAGILKASGNIQSDGQVLAAAGSAKGPSFSFTNNTNTGIYEPSINTVGVAAGGTQILQVQSGVAYTVNGANFEVDGYLRAGRSASSPAFQVGRYTGTLDGGGSATVGDGLATGSSRVLTIQAFYRGNSNEAIPLNVDFVNGGNFQISGGIPGRQYRATMVYSQDNAGW